MIDFLKTVRIIFKSKTKDVSQKKLLEDYLKLCLMKLIPVIRKNPVSLNDYSIFYGDFNLLFSIYIEIFIKNIYFFESTEDSPIVVDAGANIGLASLFIKKIFPQARILCFEPNTANFNILKRNISDNKLTEISLVNCGLSNSKELKKLFIKDSEIGDIGSSFHEDFRYFYHDKDSILTQEVRCEKLSEYITEFSTIDLLKVDIEGYEGKMMEDISQQLRKIKNIIMEYHYIGSENPLSNILSLLENNNHVYNVSCPIDIKEIRQNFVMLIKSRNLSDPINKPK